MNAWIIGGGAFVLGWFLGKSSVESHYLTGYDGRPVRRGAARGRGGSRGGRPGRQMKNCFANVDVFGAVQDRHTCYPTKADANNLTNGYPYPSCLPGGQIPDNQGGNNIPVPVDACGPTAPAGGSSAAAPADAAGWGYYGW
jgi:hypothetical protein